MTRLWVACSLALAILGLAGSAATAQNVTAFNPYNGAGLAAPAADNVRGYPVIDKPPPGGPAFNPWRPADVAAGWVSSAPMASGPAASAPVRAQTYTPYVAGISSPGSNLPPPPPGAIESRIVAIPLRGDAPGARYAPATPSPMPSPPPVSEPPPSTATVAPPPATPAPVPITRADVAPTPIAPSAPPPPATVPAPSAPVVTAPPAPPPAPEPAVANTAPPSPREPRGPPPSSGPTVASVAFASNSAEISDVAKADLDRVAKNIAQQRMSQIEVRAFAGGADPTDARKVALARALAVRSYLIDQGVKARIEVGAFSAGRGSGPTERVDILAPGP